MKYFYTLIFFVIVGSTYANTNSNLVPADTIRTLKDNSVEIEPVYPGGKDAFYNYIVANVNWPEAMYAQTYKSGKLPGPMLVSFVIEKDGSVVDVKVQNDFGYGTGEEVVRVLKNSQKWKPGMQDKRVVRVQYTLPIAIPPPTVSSIRIDEPLSEYSLPNSIKASGSIKPRNISVSKQKYLFSERLTNCRVDTFRFEEETVLSDRYSILHNVKQSIPVDSLKSLVGRIALQVIIDTSETPCLYTYDSDLNMPFKALSLDEAITKYTKWSLLPSKNGKKEATSVILVFIFTEDKIVYQHFSFAADSNMLNEIEIAEQRKFSKSLY